MSDSDLFISVSVISMSEYEIVISTEFDIIINRYWKFLICLVRVLLLFSPYIFFLQHLFFVTHRVVFCRDYPVRYVFCIEYIDRIVMRLYPFRAHFR